MKSYAKKIMTRLAAGAMALLLAVGTAATDMSVYAALMFIWMAAKRQRVFR